MEKEDAVLLVGTQSVELMNGGEIAVITFRDAEGPVTPLAIPAEEVVPLALKLIGAPPLTEASSLAFTGNAPSLDVDGLQVSRHDADPDALYVGLRLIDHAAFVRLERDLAAHLRDSLTAALDGGPNASPASSPSRH